MKNPDRYQNTADSTPLPRTCYGGGYFAATQCNPVKAHSTATRGSLHRATTLETCHYIAGF